MAPFFLQFGEETLSVQGDFPRIGQRLHSFMLVDEHLNDISLERFHGHPKVLLTLLSIDVADHGGYELLRETARRLEPWPQLKLLAVSVDSPFSLHRARHEHGFPGVTLLSTLRGRDFHRHYGVLIADYPLSGFTAPALVISDANDRVIYAERLTDTQSEFDWDALAMSLVEGLRPPALPAELSDTGTPA